MTKLLLTLAAITLTATSCATAGTARAGQVTTQKDGTTVEVRRVINHPSQRSGSIFSKLYITRDASGKIISVKRG